MAKTALDLQKAGFPREEIKKYKPWQALERHKLDKDITSWRNRAKEVAGQAAKILKEKYGASRVVLFGSLAHEAWFTLKSDIDLYAVDIPADKFFKAEAEVESIAPMFKVDLVDHKECSPELLKQIREGIEL